MELRLTVCAKWLGLREPSETTSARLAGRSAFRTGKTNTFAMDGNDFSTMFSCLAADAAEDRKFSPVREFPYSPLRAKGQIG